MKKLLLTLAIIFFGLGAYNYAHAACPTSVPFADVQAMADNNEAKITKATEAEANLVDEKQARPIPQTEMFFLAHENTTTILLVLDGTVVCTSNAVPDDTFNRVLGRING